MTVLGAILLNPPTGDGVRSRRHLAVAAEVLGCTTFEIANLFSIATPDMHGINENGMVSGGWLEARPALTELLHSASEVVMAWGVTAPKGLAAHRFKDQVEWVIAETISTGHDRVWTMRGQVRHPSRWHQFVSDKHGRTEGGDFAGRLRQVLDPVSPLSLTCH